MLTAADIMTREVVTIKGSATVAEAVQLMREKSLRSLIVDRRNERDAYAIVTETDIVYKVIAYGTDLQTVRVFEIMSKPCIAIYADLGVEYVARLFANTGIRRAPVLGEGGLVGVISVTDILRKGNFLEEPQAQVFQVQIAEAIAQAREVSARQGVKSPAAATAWDAVEELQAAAAHQQAKKLPKTAFDDYCEENPEALEARIYDL